MVTTFPSLSSVGERSTHHQEITKRGTSDGEVFRTAMRIGTDEAAALRHAMVATLRRDGLITTESVAAAMSTVPRHIFAPGEPLEKGTGQTPPWFRRSTLRGVRPAWCRPRTFRPFSSNRRTCDPA